MTGSDRIVLVCTHGPEDAEEASISLALALMAQAAAREVVLGFRGAGGLLLQKGTAERVAAPGFAPLKQIIDAYVEDGGRLLIAASCLRGCRISPQALIDGVEVISGAAFTRECSTAARAADHSG